MSYWEKTDRLLVITKPKTKVNTLEIQEVYIIGHHGKDYFVNGVILIKM